MKNLIYLPFTKIAPPNLNRLEKNLERDQVVESVITQLNRRASLISGGAGIGKTTLMAHIASLCERNVFWINIDGDDRNLDDFLTMVYYAIQRNKPGEGEMLLHFLTNTRPFEESIKLPLGLLVNVFSELDPFILFIDNFENISDKERITGFIGALIENLPEKHHLIVSSRYAFRFQEQPKWRVRQWLNEINESDLLLDIKETGNLLSLNDIKPPHPGWKYRLLDITGGRIGLLVLLINQLKSSPEPEKLFQFLEKNKEHPLLEEYIISQVLDRLPENHRDFLTKTFLFPRLLPALIDGFLGTNDSAEILESFAKNNFLCFKLSDEPLEFIYHKMLKDCARKLWQRNTSSEESANTFYRLGDYLRENGALLDAVSLLIKGRATGEALDVLNESLEEHPTPIQRIKFYRCLREIPENRINEYPALLLIKSDAELSMGKVEKALQTLTTAIGEFEIMNDDNGVLNAYIRQAWILRFAARFDQMKKLCKKALELAGEEDTPTRLHIEFLLLCCSGTEYSLESRRRILEKRVEISLQRNEKLEQAKAYIGLAGEYYYQIGEFQKAIEMFKRNIPVFEKFGDIKSLCSCWMFLGIMQMDYYLTEEAEKSFKKLLEIVETYGMYFYRKLAWLGLSMVYTKIERLDDAWALLCLAEEYSEVNSDSFTDSLQNQALLNYHLAARNEEPAMRLIELKMKTAENSGSEDHLAAELLKKGDALCSFGKWNEGKELLLRSLDMYQSLEKPYHVMIVNYKLSGRILDESSGETKEYLRSALRTARKYNFDFYFQRCPSKHNIKQLAVALKENIETQYATRLLAGMDNPVQLKSLIDHKHPRVKKAAMLAMESQGRIDEIMIEVAKQATRGRPGVKQVAAEILARQNEQLVKPLRIRCFGKFQVWAGNMRRPIDDSAWGLAKAKNIFKYLLIHRRQPIHQEVLLDLFWRDSDLKRGLDSVRRAIYCIRRALQPALSNYAKSAYISHHNQHYTLLLPDGSEVDYDLFERHLDFAKTALLQGDLRKARKHFLNMTEIFSDEFLPEDIYWEWLEPIRQRFKIQFIDLGIRLAMKLTQAGFHENALDITQILKEKDPCNEDVTALMMKAYHRSGYPSLALSVYKDYSRNIKKSLAHEPSHYLQQLSQAIASSRTAH